MRSKSTIPQDIHDHDLSALYKRAAHPREKMRFLALLHLQDGKKINEVAALVKVTPNTIYRWVRSFQSKGVDGLREQPGRGKKPLIPNSEQAAFRQAVEELQANRTGGCITGKDVLQLMKDKYNIECTLKSAYNHLKRASLVWISARSKHPKADLQKQQDFKKNFDPQ